MWPERRYAQSVGRSWAPLIASVLLGACATTPAEITPVATPLVRTSTTVPTPVQPTAAEPHAVAISVRRPAVDLRPPPPIPLLSLNRQYGGNDSSPDYVVELNSDGTGSFIGHSDVCVKGEVASAPMGAARAPDGSGRSSRGAPLQEFSTASRLDGGGGGPHD